MALANLSSAISLDDMLSGLEKTVGLGTLEGSEHGGSAKASRRSAGRTSIMTRGTSASRIDCILDDSIRKQASMEARSYGRQHPSGAASEAARRARAATDSVRDAATRVASYHQRVAANPYASQAYASSAPKSHNLERPARSKSPQLIQDTDSSRQSAGGVTPRSSGYASVHSGRPQSPRSPREPRSTPLGAVFVGPRTERTSVRPRSVVHPF
jgi:hypothetical protein